MYRRLIFAVTFGASLAVPATALAAVPIPPPNLHGCNGVLVAVGDHPEASPAFVAQIEGLPVAVAIAEGRQDGQCTHP